MIGKSLAVSITLGTVLAASFNKSFNTAELKVKKLGDALKKTGDQKAEIAQFRALKKSIGATAAAMQAAQAKTTALAKEIKATNHPSKTLIRDFEQAKRKSAQLKASFGDQSAKLQKLRSGLRSAGIETRKLGQAEKMLGRNMDGTRRKMERLNKAQAAKSRLGALKGRAIGALGAVYGAGRVIGKSLDIERKTIRLRTVVNTKNVGASIKQSVGHAIKFAQNSLATEGQILDIEYSLNSAGLSASAARAGSEIVSKLATVTNGNAEEVGVIVGDTFNNFSKSLSGTVDDKLQRIGNVLLKTQEKFSIKNFGQLGEGIKEASAAAAIAHVPFTQMAAAIGQLNSAGLKGTQAGTGFTDLLSQLAIKSDKLGITIQHTASGQVDFIATMGSLKERMAGVGDSTAQLAFLQQKLGIQAGKAAGALLNNFDALKSGYSVVASKNDKLTSDYKSFTDSASGQWTMLTQNVSILGNVMGGTLLPAIKPVLHAFGTMIGWVIKGIQKFPVIGEIIGGIAIGFGVYATALGAVTAAQWAWNTAMVTNYANLVKTVSGAIWAGTMYAASAVKIGLITAAQWAWNVAMNANPIGLVITGVAALAGGAVLLYKNWDSVTKWFGKKLDWLTDKFSLVGDTWNAIFGSDKKASVTHHVKTKIDAIKKPVFAKAAPAALAATMAVASPAFAQPKPLIQPVTQQLAQAQSAQPKPLIQPVTQHLAQAQAAQPKPLIQPSTPAALQNIMAASAAPAPKSTVVHQDNRASYVMHVNVDGGDPQAVKAAVSDAMAEKEREHAARTRGALFDYQGG